MKEKELRELKKAVMNEFLSDEEDTMRQGYREMGKHLAVIQEEMNLTRSEALYFVATMMGSMMRGNL